LLSVITYGEATCLNKKSGYCVLANPCAYYYDKGLWDYDFKLMFNNTDNSVQYLRIPLATFAANYEEEGGLCAIFVEFLDVNNDDSKVIMLGGMFFQSFYAQFGLFGVNSAEISIYVNQNALPNTEITGVAYYAMESPFVVTPQKLAPNILSTNGMPRFDATVAGIADTTSYFTLDFSSSNTVVWASNCTTTGFGNYDVASCSQNPTQMECGFNATNVLPDANKVGTFVNARFGGYVVDGV